MNSLVNLNDIQKAIEEGTVVPFFQPLVELRSGRLAGFEVLARLRHPDHGLILPENFISLAEENGLIAELTRQVLRKAFLSAPALPDPLVLAINMSPILLYDLTLPDLIRVPADEAGFPLHRLIIEVTESALVRNLPCARRNANELKRMGCRLALDDFGTGYSCLRHLQDLPFSELKIDRSFVESMTYKRESRKIVAAVVGLGSSLGMITVAEGVETHEQAEMLLALGCELGQGWLYGRPMPAERIPDMIAASPWPLSTRMSLQGNQVLPCLEALPAQRLAQLQAIYNGAPVGLCFLDRNLRYVSLNQRLADLNGAPLAAHIGKKVEEMVPQLFSQFKPFLLRALHGEAIEGVEVFRASPLPEMPDRTILVSYQPALDEAQEVIGISVAIVDITERKRAEDALREREERQRLLTQPKPQMLWTLDANGNVLEMSPRWVILTGLSIEKTLKLGWLDALHPEDVGRTVREIREARRSGKMIDAEYRVKTADGKWRWLRFRGWPHFGPSGEVVRWYGGAEDIDERQEMESMPAVSSSRSLCA